MLRRIESKRKLWQPTVTEQENLVRDNLADLRSMVAREYCCIILGIEDAKRFHHMNNKNNTSLSDKDRRLFEKLLCMAVRVVWIALQRKHYTLIGNSLPTKLVLWDTPLSIPNKFRSMYSTTEVQTYLHKSVEIYINNCTCIHSC